MCESAHLIRNLLHSKGFSLELLFRIKREVPVPQMKTDHWLKTALRTGHTRSSAPGSPSVSTSSGPSWTNLRENKGAYHVRATGLAGGGSVLLHPELRSWISLHVHFIGAILTNEKQGRLSVLRPQDNNKELGWGRGSSAPGSPSVSTSSGPFWTHLQENKGA